MPLADGELAYVEGSYNVPPTVYIRDAAGTLSKGGPDLPDTYPVRQARRAAARSRSRRRSTT